MSRRSDLDMERLELTHTAKECDQNGDDTGDDHQVTEKPNRLGAEIISFTSEIAKRGSEIRINFDVDTDTEQSDANEKKDDVQNEEETSHTFDAAR